MKLYKFTTVEQLASAIKTLISKNLSVSTRLTASDFLNIGTASELTISSGEITVTQTYHSVDTEGDTGSDDLDTINGGVEGDILILRAANASRDVVVKDSTDNLRLAGDFTMDAIADSIVLYNYNGSVWLELSRSDNA